MFLGNFLIIVLVGAMGREGLLGAHIVAIRIEAISFMPGFAVSLAAATLVGQWLGAGNPHIASRAIIATTTLASAFMGGVDIHLGSITIPNPKPLGELGLPGLWIGLCAEIVIRGALFSFRFFQGKWKTAKV